MENAVTSISTAFFELHRCIGSESPSADCAQALAELSAALLSKHLDRVKLARLAELQEKLEQLLDSVQDEHGAVLALSAVELSSGLCRPPLAHANQIALRFAAMCQTEQHLSSCSSVLSAAIKALQAGHMKTRGVLESGACRVASRVLLAAGALATSSKTQHHCSLAEANSWWSCLELSITLIQLMLHVGGGCAADAVQRLKNVQVPQHIASLLSVCCDTDPDHTLPWETAAMNNRHHCAYLLLDVVLRVACTRPEGAAVVAESAPAVIEFAHQGTLQLSEHNSDTDLMLNSLCCAIFSQLFAQGQLSGSSFAAVDSPAGPWPVQLSLDLDAQVNTLKTSHLNETLQIEALTSIQRIVHGAAKSDAAVCFAVLLQVSGGGVIHQITRCLQNLDESIMLTAVETMECVLRILYGESARKVSSAAPEVAHSLWQQLHDEAAVQALVACSSDYHVGIRCGSLRCLHHLVNGAVIDSDTVICGMSLLEYVAAQGAASAASAALRLWPEHDGDLASACLGAEILATFASTDHQGGLSDVECLNLVASLTLAVVEAARVCWGVSQHERRWRRRHADVLRSQNEDQHTGIPRARRRSRGYGSSPVTPERQLASAEPQAAARHSSPSSSDEEARQIDESMGPPASKLLAAATLALSNSFLFRPFLRVFALRCGLLPVLLRLLHGAMCSSLYNEGRRRCMRDEYGFQSRATDSPSAGQVRSVAWQPLLQEDWCERLQSDPAWQSLPDFLGRDNWQVVVSNSSVALSRCLASEDLGAMLLDCGQAAGSACVNALTCLTNLCADCDIAKGFILVPSVFVFLSAAFNSSNQQVRLVSCLLLSHLSQHTDFGMTAIRSPIVEEFHQAAFRTVVSLLGVSSPYHDSRAIWGMDGGVGIAQKVGLDAEPSDAQSAAESLDSYLLGARQMHEGGAVGPIAAKRMQDSSFIPPTQRQAAGISCTLNWLLKESSCIGPAERDELIPLICDVVVDSVVELAHEAIVPSTHEHIIANSLQSLLGLLDMPSAVSAGDCMGEVMMAALVALISNDDEDVVAKRAFTLLQMSDSTGVHHLLNCMMQVCSSLGSRKTLPGSLVEPVRAAVGVLSPVSGSLTDTAADCARWWLEKALVVVNALVFTSEAATCWLVRQQSWNAGLGPLAHIMLTNVGHGQVLSAALLATNLAMCKQAVLSREAETIHLVPLISFIFGSISSAGESEDDEVLEARGVMLHLSCLLLRGSLTNCCAFIQGNSSSATLVAELATSGSRLSDVATQLLLELAENAVRWHHGGLAAEASRLHPQDACMLLDVLRDGPCQQALLWIASHADTTTDANAARAAQCVRDLRDNHNRGEGVPHDSLRGTTRDFSQ